MKRKHTLAALLMIPLLLFAACAKTEKEEETAPLPETEETAVPGTEDRPVSEDYLTVTPAGVHDVRILFLNVGKADAILLRIDGQGFMIDTGTESAPPMLAAGMNLMDLDSLRGIFITHTDSDHVGGLSRFIADYPVETVYTSAISADWDKVERLRGDVPRTALDPGQVVEAGEGVWFEVLGPVRYNPRDDNNSLVLRLRVNGATLLFCGDMMTDEEKSLMYAGMDLDCDLLKVGHHGEKDATSDSFLQEASPSVAVICTDRAEESDTAHKSIIKALGKIGAEIYITDETPVAYDVTVTEDGEIEAENVRTPEPAPVSFVSVSKADQLVILENTGSEAVDLGGWWIVSETGGEIFRFPDGTLIGPGETLSVGTNHYTGEPDLRWNDTRVWHKSKEDRAVLIDPWGNKADFMVSE